MNWFKNIFAKKPSREEFPKIALKALEDSGHTEGLEYDESQFAIKALNSDGEMEKIWYLENAFKDYCEVPASERSDVLQAFFASVEEIEMPKNLEEALPNLLPRLQVKAFFEENALNMKLASFTREDGTVPRFAHKSITEHFAYCFVLDSDSNISYISQETLDDWGTTIDELFPKVLKNLEKQTPDPFEEVSPGLYISQYNDTHDASRLLLLDRIKEVNVKGRPIVMAPNRDVLIVTGESDHENQANMLAIVEKVMQDPRPMLALPLVLSETEWHPYVPNEHNESKEQFQYWYHASMADVYNTQKQLLEQVHEIENIDIFVATYMVTQNESTSEYSSMASWALDVHSWLPKTDGIAFAKDENVICTPWEVAEEIVGDLIKPVDCYPKRFEVVKFPSAPQLEELKKHAIN